MTPEESLANAQAKLDYINKLELMSKVYPGKSVNELMLLETEMRYRKAAKNSFWWGFVFCLVLVIVLIVGFGTGAFK